MRALWHTSQINLNNASKLRKKKGKREKSPLVMQVCRGSWNLWVEKITGHLYLWELQSININKYIERERERIEIKSFLGLGPLSKGSEHPMGMERIWTTTPNENYYYGLHLYTVPSQIHLTPSSTFKTFFHFILY